MIRSQYENPGMRIRSRLVLTIAKTQGTGGVMESPMPEPPMRTSTQHAARIAAVHGYGRTMSLGISIIPRLFKCGSAFLFPEHLLI